MKRTVMILMFALISMNSFAEMSVMIYGKQAKALFESLTGDLVTTDEPSKNSPNTWRQGENVDCWIKPKQLQPYGCSIHLDDNGKGTPRD